MPPPTETSAEDALRRLEARLERASGAAERLFAEAASEAAAAALRMGERIRPDGAPAQGWQPGGSEGSSRAAADLELVAALWREARGVLPPEVRDRLAEAVRELLLAVRALIDWYLERLERERGEPVEVEDIPVR
jgi:hypothetical protein